MKRLKIVLTIISVLLMLLTTGNYLWGEGTVRNILCIMGSGCFIMLATWSAEMESRFRMNTMKINNKIRSISKELDILYGEEGTRERDDFRNEAYAYCVETKKQECIIQEKLVEC